MCRSVLKEDVKESSVSKSCGDLTKGQNVLAKGKTAVANEGPKPGGIQIQFKASTVLSTAWNTVKAND